jgi:DNA-binding GntR family transcriptional regulator
MKLLTVVEAIIEKLKQDVHNGVYSTGAALNIDELARTYEVSKTPIREALGHLAKEGLVTYKPRIGWSVCSLSKEDFSHYLEVRYALRKFLSDNLGPWLDRLDFKKLEEMNHSMKEYLAHGKYRELIETDDLFHMAIFSVYPNPVILSYLGQVSSLIKLQRIGMLEDRLQHNEYSLFHNAPHEHDAIIEALKTRDQKHISEVSDRHQKTILSALTLQEPLAVQK